MADPIARPGDAGRVPDSVKNAIRRYEERLARDPDSPAFAPLAEAYRKAGRTREAIALCEAGIRRFPDYTIARVILAKAYLAEGNEEGALAELSAVVARVPGDVQSHRMLAELTLKRGDLERAVAHLERAVALDSEDRESRVLLDLLQGGGNEGERSAISRLLEDETFATVTFGTICLQQGLIEEAAAAFLRVARREPTNAVARERLGQALSAKRERRRG